MRVLQAIAGGEYGGAENFFVSQTLALHRAGLEQRVVMRRNRARAATLRAGGLDPLEVRFGGPLDLATPLRLKREVARFRPDVVVTWMSRASHVFPRGEFVQAGRLGGYYKLKYFRKCHHLLAITPDLMDYVIRQGWPRERVHYMPKFVDLEAAPPTDRAEFDTPSSAPLVVAVGRLHVVKALDVLITALAEVKGAFLWLAGEGPERTALKRLADELGVRERVRFLGWRTDLAALYGAADICVFPSRYEGFGQIVLEAWAAGVPLIAAAAAGPAGLITPEEDGLLVAVDDAGALAAAMRRLIADAGLRARLVEGGRAKWQADFTEAVAVRHWREALAKVTGQGPAPPRVAIAGDTAMPKS